MTAVAGSLCLAVAHLEVELAFRLVDILGVAGLESTAAVLVPAACHWIAVVLSSR